MNVLKKDNKKKKQIKKYVLKLMFFLNIWSRLNIYLPGPEKSDSSSQTTYTVLFPGSNSKI